MDTNTITIKITTLRTNCILCHKIECNYSLAHAALDCSFRKKYCEVCLHKTKGLWGNVNCDQNTRYVFMGKLNLNMTESKA